MRSKNESKSYIIDPLVQNIKRSKSSVTCSFPYIITSLYNNITICDIRKPSLLWSLNDINIKTPKYANQQSKHLVYGRKLIFSNAQDKTFKITDLSNPAAHRDLVTVTAKKIYYSGDYIGKPIKLPQYHNNKNYSCI